MYYTQLPNTDQRVSALGLGSYETLCYLEYRDIVELVSTAFELGITLFDVAHYRRAPHTEVVLMRALADAGIKRDDFVLVTKVFGRDDQDMATQLEESLQRLGTDRVDGVLCYGPRWDIGDAESHAVEVADLVSSGRARWWGGLNWSAADITAGVNGLLNRGAPRPVMMQMKYNFARRSIVESDEYMEAWRTLGLVLQASDSLEGGVIAGKGDSDRVLGRDPGGIREQIKAHLPELRQVASEFGVTLAELAVIFAAGFEHTGTVLVGASRPDQLRQNVRAIERVAELSGAVRERLESLEITGHRLDVPPGTVLTPDTDPYVKTTAVRA